MHPAAIGFFVIVAIAAACGAITLIKRHREHLERNLLLVQARDLLDRAEQGDREAEDQLSRQKYWGGWDSPYPRTSGAENDRSEVVRKRVEIRQEYERKIGRIQESYAAWQQALAKGTANEQVLTGVSLDKSLKDILNSENRSRVLGELGLSEEALKKDLIELTQQYADDLWLRAQEGQEAFLEFRQFMFDAQHGRIRDSPKDVNGSRSLPLFFKLVRPEGWNEKIAEHLDDPHFDDFDAGQMQPGEAHRRAVEIRHSPDDWVEAAIILAYANSNRQTFEEVGEQLRIELQELVVTRRLALVS